MGRQEFVTQVKNVAAKAVACVGALAAYIGAAPITAMASDTFKNYSSAKTDSSSNIIKNLASTVGNVATYIGAIFLIVGVLTFFIAFRNEDSEGKNRAGIGIAASIGLLAFSGIMGMFF